MAEIAAGSTGCCCLCIIGAALAPHLRMASEYMHLCIRKGMKIIGTNSTEKTQRKYNKDPIIVLHHLAMFLRLPLLLVK